MRRDFSFLYNSRSSPYNMGTHQPQQSDLIVVPRESADGASRTQPRSHELNSR